MNCESIYFTNYNPKLNDSYEQLKMVKDFKTNEQRMLILSGKSGVGKTLLSREFEKYVDGLALGKKSAFITGTDLYFMILDYFYPTMMKGRKLKKVYEDLFNYRYLIIDDFDKHPIDTKGYFSLGFQDLLDKYSSKILLTTNLTWDKLKKKYGEHISSRLSYKMVWVNIFGVDQRGRSNG